MANHLIDPDIDRERREIQREYLDFFDDGDEEGIYFEKAKELINEGKNRMIININDLQKKQNDRFKKRYTKLFSEDCFEELLCCDNALRDYIENIDTDYAKAVHDFHVGFEGAFKTHVTPRTLKANLLGQMVCCEGIVTKCSLVRPKVVRSVHYCPATKKTMERRYTDMTSYDAFPTSSAYPTEDENKNPLETEYGLSTYKDHQSFTIQELPENAPAGQLPRSVDIIADDDMADVCKPGDRVRVCGVYRCLPSKQNGFTSGTFRTILIANNIILMSKDSNGDRDLDVPAAKKLFNKNKKNIFELLGHSLAPSIMGHDEIKQAILCLLLGGVEKVLPNGARLRGDINVLLIGDPSVAKSQMLRYVLHSAPRAIPTTGRGSSGVGLTAAVTSDSETGERRLEAGAMVLGDRGVVCIDEFDKMSDIDRTAIHEVMEQGRVTIAKAGIHAKLNARCSVLAAANPVYGKYDLYKSPMENIGMQDSLLSRFDLLFVLLDEHDNERDKMIAEHVVKLHRYRDPKEPDGKPLPLGVAVETLTTIVEEASIGDIPMYEENRAWTSATSKKEKIVSMAAVRNYIHVAKQSKPKLSDSASELISKHYVRLRGEDEQKDERERTMPITARTLETLIRLSTSIAKCRLKTNVDEHDAIKAIELLEFACFKKKPKERIELEGRKRKRDEGGSAGEGDSDGEEGEGEDVNKKTTRRQRGISPENGGDDENVEGLNAPKRAKKTIADDEVGDESNIVHLDTQPAAISVDRYKQFKGFLRTIFDANNTETMPLAEVKLELSKRSGRTPFSESELKASIEKMADDNIAMVSDDTLILI